MPAGALVALLVFMVVASALEWMAVEVAALVVLATLLISGELTVAEATSGFADPAVVTVLMMMILSEAIVESGVVAQVGHRISRISRGSSRAQIALLFCTAGLLSMFISNTAAVAMFIPVAIQLSKQMRTSPSKLLLPLNYAAIFGGTCTLVGTSTNILVSSLAAGRGVHAFSMFEFLRMGGLFFVVGMAYNFLLVRWLPDRGDSTNLTGKYQLATYLTEVRVPAGSPLVGRTVVQEKISDRYHLNVLEILRGVRKIAFDLRSTPIEANDVLIVRGTRSSSASCCSPTSSSRTASWRTSRTSWPRSSSRPHRRSRACRSRRSTSAAGSARSCWRCRAPAR